MKTFISTTALASLIASVASAATDVGSIDQLTDGMDNKMVRVSGVVSWIEDANEFTIADKTGDIEVNLKQNRPGLKEGQYVTVVGNMDENLFDDAIDNATVSISSLDFDSWKTAYEAEYEIRYDRNGLDSVFYETIDWDNDMYDDYYLVKTD